MCSHVSLERARSCVRLATDTAQVRLLAAAATAGRGRRASTGRSAAEAVVNACAEAAERYAAAGPSTERRQSADAASIPRDRHRPTGWCYLVLMRIVMMMMMMVMTLSVGRRLQHSNTSWVAVVGLSKDALRHTAVTDCR